jgi:hypothetical protein
MNRTLIFAHYDQDGAIDDYVIKYLEELKKFISNIIFVSDGEITTTEINKIKNLIIDFSAYKHNEYDFGSYKIGYQLLVAKHPQILEKTDELLFVNDSCYCIGSFEKVFNTEIANDIDAWGLTEGYSDHSFSINSYHLQSYFISLRSTVFKEQFFVDFINNITKLENKEEIINKYEIGFSQLMLKNHKKLFAVFNISQINDFIFKNSPYLIAETFTITGTANDENQKSTILKNQLLLINEPNHIHSDKFFVLAYMKLPVIKRRIISEYSDLGSDLVFFWVKIISIAFPQFDINQIFLHNHRIGNALKDVNLVSDLKYTQGMTIRHRRFYSYIFYGFCIFIYTFPYLGSILFKPNKIKKFLYRIKKELNR